MYETANKPIRRHSLVVLVHPSPVSTTSNKYVYITYDRDQEWFDY